MIISSSAPKHSHNFISQHHLYGRDQAIARLTASFDSIGRGSGEIVLVPGYSGVGKFAGV